MAFFSSFHLFLPASIGRLSQNWANLSGLRLAQWRDLRALCHAGRQLQGWELVGHLLRELDIVVEYEAAELDYLPARGAFVAMANQPNNLLEELVLLYLLGKHRPTLRAVATSRLQPLLANLARQLGPAAPTSLTSPVAPAPRPLLGYLHNDVPLLLFAGNATPSRSVLRASLSEESWPYPITKRLLKAARVPVVPMWVEGPRTTPFTWRRALNPLLGMARLPTELLNRRGQTIRVRVGQPVPPAALARVPTPEQLAYLWARSRTLGPSGAPAEAHVPPLAVPAVLAEVPAELLEADLAGLRASRCLVRHGQWEVYAARQNELPHVLHEIGRLRELALRRAGAGTQQVTDLDAYDAYHRHLFLYDRAARRLVGAYRIGVGLAIMRQRGKQGFYLHTLFRLNKALAPLLRQTLELSRLFVRVEYQGQPLPLALLWQGLAEYVVAHPDHCYLLGAISISDPSLAIPKAVMADYIRQNCFNEELAPAVQTRKRYRFRPLAAGNAPASPGIIPDIQQLIAVPEAGRHSVPAPLRQYVRQNARFLGFNMDPRFSNALNGLLLLDVRDLPVRAQNLLAHCTASAHGHSPRV